MKFLESVYQSSHHTFVEKNNFKSSHNSQDLKNNFKDSIARMPKIKFHYNKDDLNTSDEEVNFLILGRNQRTRAKISQN